MAAAALPWFGWSDRKATAMVVGTGVIFVVFGVLLVWVASTHTGLLIWIPRAYALVGVGAALIAAGIVWFRRLRSPTESRRSHLP